MIVEARLWLAESPSHVIPSLIGDDGNSLVSILYSRGAKRVAVDVQTFGQTEADVLLIELPDDREVEVNLLLELGRLLGIYGGKLVENGRVLRVVL
jgi:hypothetical protein